LSLPNIYIYRDQTAYAIGQKSRELYDNEYSFIFGDFNFDGQEDLAICNGKNGGYEAPSYDVYLYNVGLSKFVRNRKRTSQFVTPRHGKDTSFNEGQRRATKGNEGQRRATKGNEGTALTRAPRRLIICAAPPGLDLRRPH
jgi:hypothetical protein